MCGATTGGLSREGIDVSKETIIEGTIQRDGTPVTGYVRLLNEDGEFTAEVPTSATGAFRFFAAPGSWTVRALSRHGNGELAVDATRGVNEIALSVATA